MILEVPLALNDGYDGGALGFPETDRALRPGTGAAVLSRGFFPREN